MRRRANYSLADALASGAVGGVLGAAAGTALCVVRDGTSNPGGGWVAAWLFRLLPFGGLGLVEGAVIGLAVGVAMAWLFASARRATVGRGAESRGRAHASRFVRRRSDSAREEGEAEQHSDRRLVVVVELVSDERFQAAREPGHQR